jgi:aminopeptidase N
MEIHAKYTTELLDEIDGFYQDFYIDNSGNKKYLATTQFQAVEARRAFPCYDGNLFTRYQKLLKLKLFLQNQH